MKRIFPKNSKQEGYAILFAVVMVSIISTIAIGLSNSTYKQLILSSLAKDSQAAFYQSDTAIECALYADNVDGLFTDTNTDTSYSCGIDKSGASYSLTKVTSTVTDGMQYDLTFTSPIASDPCFTITVLKTATLPNTDIKARGYNSCTLNNPKTVEREIEVTY